METRGVFLPEVAAQFVEDAGKKYRPSRATEGEIFMCQYCHRCQHGTVDNCRILAFTLIFDVDDPQYPQEWQYGADGQPTCTAFELEVPSHG